MKGARFSIFMASIAVAMGVVVINIVPGDQKSLGLALIAVGGLLFILNINKLKARK